MTSKRTILSIATLATGALLLSGCGGESADTAATESSAAATAGGSGSASAGVNEAPLPDELQATLQSVLDDQRETYDFPGAIAGVWTPEGSWVGAVGSTQLDGTTEPTTADHTRIGSLTKTFTVAVLLQLAEQGKVSLDDSIEKYIPGMPNGDTATLRMLADMTSGIPSYTFNEEFGEAFGSDPTEIFTPQQLVDYVKGEDPLFPAGTEVNYSNTNTVLLGMLIEQVTGQPFAEVLAAGVLEPLGLANTSFPTDSPELPTPYFEGITLQGDPEGEEKDATFWSPSWAFTAGAMVSTLEDLRTWAVALGTGEGLFTAETQKEREESINSTVSGNSPVKSYALGFGVEDGWIGHTGTLPGYNTDMVYDPETGTTIVVIVNSDILAHSGNTGPLPANAITQDFRDAL